MAANIDADALLKQMQAKYNLAPSTASPGSNQPDPQPAPPADTSPKPAGSLIQQAGNLFKGRAAQIDKADEILTDPPPNMTLRAGVVPGTFGNPASDYELKKDPFNELSPSNRPQNTRVRFKRGGKIKGPGTTTSDSIPAKVKQTGEDILVSNGERILSAKQDQLLHRIAMERGFDSVDAMLEHGTGEPVGPTIKAGKKAAASGLSPEEEFGQANGSNLAPLNGQTTKGGYYPSPLEKALTGQQVVPAATTLERNADLGPSVVSKAIQADFADRRGVLPAASYSNEGRSGPSALPLAAAPQGTPRPPPAGVAPTANDAPSPILGASQATAKDLAPGSFADRGAGIVANRAANGQLNVTNVGTEGFSNRNSPIVDGSASALIDQKNSTYNPQRQLENMQRSRLMGTLATSENIDPAARQQAREGLKAMDAASAVGAKADLEAAQAGQVKATTAQVQQMEEMRAKLLDPNTPAAERANIIEALHALRGKTDDQVKIAEETYFDDKNPMTPLKRSFAVGPGAGRVPVVPISGNAPAAVAKLNVVAGMPVNAPDGVHTFQGKSITVKNGKVIEVK